MAGLTVATDHDAYTPEDPEDDQERESLAASEVSAIEMEERR
jgi:hypothetical protein